jgi:hypothetical protein
MVMTVHRSEVPADFLLEEFLKLETPEGYRAELIDGEIVMTPPPRRRPRKHYRAHRGADLHEELRADEFRRT